jgi:hypothetical protein
MLDDGTFLFVSESEITPEIESLMASLGSPAVGLRDGGPKSSTRNGSASTLKIAANLESHTDGE